MSKLVSVIIVTYNRKGDIAKCLESVLKNVYDNFEIIVVDNASSDGTADFLRKKYNSKIKLIKSEKNLMAGGGRNFGAKNAIGEYFLFIDSDNIVDKNMITELVLGIDKIKDAGMVGPLMYYFSDPKKIWWAGADINLWTSKTNYIGINEYDEGQYNDIIKVGHIPNVFMLKKDVWMDVNGIDADYVMHYEESDLAEKIKKCGYEPYLVPKAKTWHNVPLSNEKNIRNYGGESPERTYYTARNRVLFMRRNAPKINYLFFVLIFNNIFLLAYIFNYIKNKRWDLAKTYAEGVAAGLMNGKKI